MPRAPTITIEDVSAIADRLKAAGIAPTPRRILEEHGSGGLGTIYRLFKQWENRQEQHVDAGLTISPALQRAILEFMGREIASARAGLEARLAESEQRAAELARENERQAGVIEEQDEQRVTLQDAAALQQGKLDQIGLDLSAAREEALRERAAAESARTELAKDRLRLEAMPRLETDLATLRATYESERLARSAAEQSAAVSVAQKDSLAERVTEGKARIDMLDAQLAQLQERARRQSTELTSARVAVEAANARLEAAARDVAALKSATADARARERQAIEEAAELRGAHPAEQKK